jgi:hypothetical protein
MPDGKALTTLPHGDGGKVASYQSGVPTGGGGPQAHRWVNGDFTGEFSSIHAKDLKRQVARLTA